MASCRPAAYHRASSIQDVSSSSVVPQSPSVTRAEDAGTRSSSLVATVWRVLYSCTDELAMTLCRMPASSHNSSSESSISKGDYYHDIENSIMSTHHRVQNASLMEFVVSGGGGILHTDSMSTVEGCPDIDPEVIYGQRNVDEAVHRYGVQASKKVPPLTTVSTWSSSSSSSLSDCSCHDAHEVRRKPIGVEVEHSKSARLLR
jgi:hypothetical protein